MRKADNLPPSCAVVTKSGSLNFLEPSGPVQACNGTALPLLAQSIVAESNDLSQAFLISAMKLDGNSDKETFAISATLNKKE